MKQHPMENAHGLEPTWDSALLHLSIPSTVSQSLQRVSSPVTLVEENSPLQEEQAGIVALLGPWIWPRYFRKMRRVKIFSLMCLVTKRKLSSEPLFVDRLLPISNKRWKRKKKKEKKKDVCRKAVLKGINQPRRKIFRIYCFQFAPFPFFPIPICLDGQSVGLKLQYFDRLIIILYDKKFSRMTVEVRVIYRNN